MKKGAEQEDSCDRYTKESRGGKKREKENYNELGARQTDWGSEMAYQDEQGKGKRDRVSCENEQTKARTPEQCWSYNLPHTQTKRGVISGE